MSHRLGILGFPIGHSLSPLFHTTAFRVCGLEGSYEPIQVAPDELRNEWHNHISESFTGLNVTVPHKVPIMKLVDELSDVALAVGAVNALSRNGSSWRGTNTDVTGVLNTLAPFRDRLSGKTATVLGAGGAARAVMYALVTSGSFSKITIVNRDVVKARRLAEMAGSGAPPVHVAKVSAAEVTTVVRESVLVVQATSVGMHPNDTERPLERMNVFSSDQIVFDLIYRPRETRFLRDAREAGAETIDGLGMFLHQAAASFEFWTGVTPPLEEIRPVVEQELNRG